MSAFERARHHPVSGFPTRAEMLARQEINKRVILAVGGYPKGLRLEDGGLSIGVPPTDIAKGVFRNQITVDALERYADEMGDKLPSELKAAFLGIDGKFKWDLSDATIAKWVNDAGSIMTTGLAVSSADPNFTTSTIENGTVVIESLQDGFIDDQETMNISMTAGASVGAAFGSIFPGVGTAVGSLLGSAVGATVGAIVAWATPPNWSAAEVRLEQQAREVAAAVRNECESNQELLNRWIMEQVYALSTKWINMEMTIGYRVPLRWFDSNPGVRFELAAHRSNTQYLDALVRGQYPNTPRDTMDGYDYPRGRFQCFSTHRQRQGKIVYAGQTRTVYGQEERGACNFYCPQKLLGCLYPPIGMNEFQQYGSPRVLGALLSRGFRVPVDMECDEIEPISLKRSDFPNTDEGVRRYEQRYAELFQSQLTRNARYLRRVVKDFEVAANLVSTDLDRTIALMQTQQQVLMNRIDLERQGVLSTVETRFAGARAKHIRNMKWISLLGGAALLGGTIWRARK